MIVLLFLSTKIVGVAIIEQCALHVSCVKLDVARCLYT